MIAVDTNVLLYAHFKKFPKHALAKERIRLLVEGNSLWGIPVFCLGEFVRVATHPRLFDRPLTLSQARDLIDELLRSPSLRLLLPGNDFYRLLFEAATEGNVSGNLVFDAQIVALCREHSVTTLITEDRDFTRFRIRTEFL